MKTISVGLKRNQVVATANYGGTWRVIRRHARNVIFPTCDRYDLRNIATKQEIVGVRDKDIFPKGSEFFEAFVNQ